MKSCTEQSLGIVLRQRETKELHSELSAECSVLLFVQGVGPVWEVRGASPECSQGITILATLTSV